MIYLCGCQGENTEVYDPPPHTKVLESINPQPSEYEIFNTCRR